MFEKSVISTYRRVVITTYIIAKFVYSDYIFYFVFLINNILPQVLVSKHCFFKITISYMDSLISRNYLTIEYE